MNSTFIPERPVVQDIVSYEIRGYPSKERSRCYGSISGGHLRVCNAGEVSFSIQQLPPVGPIEISAVDRAAEVGNEHSTTLQVQSQADGLPSNG